MNVRIAKNSGFCFGVKRAIKIAMNAAENDKNTVTLGPIIHNPQMVQKLKNQGIISVDSLEEVKGRRVIIRSHGIEEDKKRKLLEKSAEVIDATCPYVSKTQQHGAQLYNEGYKVIIFGDENHPEVVALKSYVPNNQALVISNETELENFHFNKVGVISQTTRKLSGLQKVVEKLLEISAEVRVINTICNATSVRQEATAKLAKASELMIVIGGKNSSNTKMLARICNEHIKTFHIETSDEIRKEWFDDIKENLGITAGASTPDWIIVEVYNKILEYIGDEEKQIEKFDDIPIFKEDKC
ncbi:MAG: 4-hydroxy-3-methylbut-2-enyl diphosphate reductase [Candidatus Cloacimonetes bacterium]|nr:4-hydroxy-3-methylbut-2-enyl diphosphate reductase [Candidatus Cloacimonadota bacterium]